MQLGTANRHNTQNCIPQSIQHSTLHSIQHSTLHSIPHSVLCTLYSASPPTT